MTENYLILYSMILMMGLILVGSGGLCLVFAKAMWNSGGEIDCGMAVMMFIIGLGLALGGVALIAMPFLPA